MDVTCEHLDTRVGCETRLVKIINLIGNHNPESKQLRLVLALTTHDEIQSLFIDSPPPPTNFHSFINWRKLIWVLSGGPD